MDLGIEDVAPDCLLLFHDVPTGIARVMLARRSFRHLISPAMRDGRGLGKLELSLQVRCEFQQETAYRGILSVELRPSTTLIHETEKLVLQDGLVVNTDELFADELNKETTDKIMRNRHNLRSIALSIRSRRDSQGIAN